MSLWDRLRGLFASSESSQDDDSDEAFYLYIRCDRCHDLVAVRINRRNDLSQEFNPSSGVVTGYRVQKGVVDQRCFRPINVSLMFDPSQRELSRDIAGGEYLTREQYQEAKAAKTTEDNV